MDAHLVRYGKTIAAVRPASGVRGILCRSVDGSVFFRVTHADATFTDYDFRHDDLPITIDADSFASFYHCGGDLFLDHSPEVLGLAQVNEEPQTEDA